MHAFHLYVLIHILLTTTRSLSNMAPPSILEMFRDLETVVTIYLQAGTEAAIERGIDDIRIHILPTYSFNSFQNGANRDVLASCVRVVLHFILALLLVREAELHRSPFEGFQELSQFIASGKTLLDCCSTTVHNR